MPANEYYDSTGIPSSGSALNTRIFNAEFNAIEAGFNKLPQLSGFQDRLVRINDNGSLIRTIHPDSLATDLEIELETNRNIANGHAGLSLQKLQLKNQANTFTSLLQNTATAERTWTLPDADGAILDSADITVYAPVDSPAFTGSPTVPTPADLDSASTQIINTAFVKDAIDGAYGNYLYMQDGIFIQYGAALSHATPGTAVNVDLYAAFDNSSYFTFGVVQAVLGYTEVAALSASQLSIKCTVASTYVFWMAIGLKNR